MKKLYLRVVTSEQEPSLPSLRPASGNGKGNTLKREMKDAGFNPGDRVVLVLADELDVLWDPADGSIWDSSGVKL